MNREDHGSADCPDFPGLRGDRRCKHNPPTGTLGTVPFIRCRGCLDHQGNLWLETLYDGVWFPSMCSGAWTFIADDGQVLTRGRPMQLVPEVVT